MTKNLFLVFILSFTVSFLFNPWVSSAYEKEIKSLAAVLAENIAQVDKKIIAVVDFTDLQGNVTELGRFIAEEFSVSLFGTGKEFEVVDRTHLKSILQEHKLALTGLIDPSAARKLGQLAGVQALVTGTITPFGESVRLSVKILDTETAKVIGASSGQIAKTKAIEELLGRGIETTAASFSKPVKAVSTSASKSKAVQSTEVQGFTFELKECKRSGESVTCTLLVTNNEEDRELRLYANDGSRKSRIFDNLGNEYIARRCKIGNKENPYNAEILLVSGIPTKAILSFTKISLETTGVALLEVRCRSGDDFKVQFRNIPFSK